VVLPDPQPFPSTIPEQLHEENRFTRTPFFYPEFPYFYDLHYPSNFPARVPYLHEGDIYS
jgi:hypothetical protein